MTRIAAGVVRFQQGAFKEKEALFKSLAAGQSPEALFITCSDSRIDPNLLTQTEPGELFICRVAGNIVPPHTEHTGAMTASIEFALGALKTPHIIICGHTDCGAMKGMMNPALTEKLPHVRAWLDHARPAAERAGKAGAGLSEGERLNLLTRENVLLQIAHIKTHPEVAAALAAGATRIHGWVYDFVTGEVVAYDEAKGAFIPVAERYREALEDPLEESADRAPPCRPE